MPVASKKVQKADKSDTLLLRESAVRALGEIIELAGGDSADTKQKFEIYKWICEMHFGKPGTARADSQGERCFQLSFEGELEKWTS